MIHDERRMEQVRKVSELKYMGPDRNEAME